MFVGLLFYIPEQDERRIGNSKLSAPSGGTTLEVVVIVIVIVVIAPLDHDPHPTIFKKSQNLIKCLKGNYYVVLITSSQPDLRYTNIFPTTLYVCGSPFLHP